MVEKKKVMLKRVEQDFREATRPVDELLLEMDKIRRIEFPKNP